MEEDGDGVEPIRPGKADSHVFGSCEQSCGGRSSDGTCWCDELCEGFGDCCSDMAQVCDEAAAPVFPPEAGSLLTVEFIIQNGIYKAIPTRIAFDPDASLGVTTTELPWVNFPTPAPAPALGGSGVDTKRDLVY